MQAKLPYEIELTRPVVIGDRVWVKASACLAVDGCEGKVLEVNKEHNSILVFAEGEEFEIDFGGEVLL